MIGIARLYVVSSLVFIAVLSLLTGAKSIDSKGYKGHPSSFDPAFLSAQNIS